MIWPSRLTGWAFNYLQIDAENRCSAQVPTPGSAIGTFRGFLIQNYTKLLCLKRATYAILFAIVQARCSSLSLSKNRQTTMISINLKALEPYQQKMGRAFVIEMVRTYLKNSPTLLTTIHKKLSEQDLEEFTRAAHILKSNSATMGAEKLAALCEMLEQAGLAGRLDRIRSDIETLEQEYQQVCSQLSQLLENFSDD
jgi:HPt (histidine-containing phosphotransfer) domain-containing protein